MAVTEPVCSNMQLAVKESNHDSLPQDDFIWEYQMNLVEWMPYSDAISSAIEHAYNHRSEEIVIDENYRVNLIDYVEECINDPHHQRAVQRRCPVSSNSSTDGEDEGDLSCRERLCTPLGLPVSCSTTGDTTYYGSPFIHDWLLIFTEGKMTVTFNTIFSALRDGLIEEGQNDAGEILLEIVGALHEVEKTTHGQCSSSRIERLKDCCAKLYTKQCYIYRAVNAALRDNDQNKLRTLGPFCYLLFNYVSRRFQDNPSTLDRLRRIFRPNKIRSVTLFRGDRNLGNIVEGYRRAAGDNSKRFKWLTFVSTSHHRANAEKFACDILYIIEIRCASSNEDQLKDLTTISHFTKETEVLLLPGVQFQVNKVEFDDEKVRYLVYIKINSSYISKLI